MMATVLVIETEAPLMRLMSWFLLESGHRVMAASSLAVAQAQSAAQPQVIVFNTHMELDTKREAIAEIRALSPDSRILDIRDPGAPLSETGADAYLALPFDSYDLLTAVRRLEASAS
jgi:CheY-like chemotaxis protein